jgi:transcriptional regulator with XRE-family HTH domain
MAQSDKSFGNRVRQLRKSRGWSQEQLASIAGGSIDQTMISRIENRPDYEPGVFTSARIARALGVQVDALLAADPRSGMSASDSRESAASKWMVLEETSISDALRHIQRRVQNLEASHGTRRPGKKKKAR